MSNITDSINAHLRAAEVANVKSVLGELNQAMNLSRNLPDYERKAVAEQAKEIAEDKGIPFNHPDL